MTNTGPRADRSLDDLPSDLPVLVETLGDGPEKYTTIHDPEYDEPPGECIQMPLEDALSVADGFCPDCFTTAMVQHEQ